MTASASLLRQLLGAQRGPLALSFVGALGFLVALLAIPLAVRHGVEGLISDRPRAVTESFVALLALGTMQAVFGALRKYQAGLLMTRAGADLRMRVHGQLQRLDVGFHGRIGSGQLLSRASGDVTLVEQFIAAGPFLVQSMLIGIGGAVLLVLLAEKLAALVLVVVVVFGALALVQGRPMYPTSTALQDRVGEYASFVEEQVHGIRVVKGHGFESANREIGGELAAAVQHLGVGLGRQRARFITGFLAVPALATLVVLVVGGRLASRGQLSPADLLAFLQYLGLSVIPLMVSAELLSAWPRARAALERVSFVLDASPAVVSPPAPRVLPSSGPPALSFRDVTFGYVPGEPVLRAVDLVVAPGSTTAIVGPSGAGKTTLLHLVGRFLDPWSGTVELDGIDIRDLELAGLRRQVCCVFQQPHLFAASVAENVAMGRAGATTDEISQALHQACCDDVIAVLSAGQDTLVGERGARLSGGQRQRVSVARGLLGEGPVLLLDDVASALDPTSAESLRQSFATHLPGRTVLMVAQHLDTVRLADVAVLMEGGRITARGTPSELERHPGFRHALALDAPGRTAW